jgi:preprotein translocase subunit SecA
MKPALATAPYAERDAPRLTRFDRAVGTAVGVAATRLGRLGPLWRMARAIPGRAVPLAGLSTTALREAAEALRPKLLAATAGGAPLPTEATLAAFPLVFEAVRRTLEIRYHPVQLVAGAALCHRRLVEMATGEGKTATGALPAGVLALAGVPVHVITVNDYLAERDAAKLTPVFAALGLSVGVVLQGMEPADRARAYAADITYVTNKEVAFDYLRDRLTTGERRAAGQRALAALLGQPGGGGLVLRGLHAAIVDEADSVLIDEARTPLLISGETDDPDAAATTAAALELAARMVRGTHFTVSESEQAPLLLRAGREAAADWVREMGQAAPALLRATDARLHLLTQALTALNIFHRDRHYIVREGKVEIVDEYTGRTMPDRSWEAGLHQIIEAKEGVDLTNARTTLARVTYQRFFNRYLRLSGMTGTAREVAGELHAVYGLTTLRVPTHRPVLRRHLGTRVAPDAVAKWHAVAARTQALAQPDTSGRPGRPVLIGTSSVADSEAVSAALTARGVAHEVLNARQDADEAAVVARAGLAGQVTVATNMAGRGTDILLAPGVAALGGLHVILTAFHDSTRIDRQLYGRAGRQGNPGSCEAIVALDDALFTRHAARAARLLGPLAHAGVAGAPARRLLQRLAQGAAARAHALVRSEQLVQDAQTDRGLGFTRGE